jgi:hypothetical protein
MNELQEQQKPAAGANRSSIIDIHQMKTICFFNPSGASPCKTIAINIRLTVR